MYISNTKHSIPPHLSILCCGHDTNEEEKQRRRKARRKEIKEEGKHMKGQLGLMWVVAVVAMALMLQTCHGWSGSSNLYPVVLVPGSGGNQLEARLTEAYRPSSLVCRRLDRGRWFRLWFDPAVIVGPLTKCFAERMALLYDPVLDDYRNAPGVETRVPYFGSTQSLLYLDPRLK